MYESIKKIAFQFLGKNVIKRYEVTIRRIFLYPFYIGEKKKCTVCEKNLSDFIHLSNNELMCPYCGSLKRNRRLVNILEPHLKNGANVLEFSPSKCLNVKFKRNDSIHYTSSDFVGEFKADKKFDITNIIADSESYDVVLCYHILEHVENDMQAMSELFRILKNGGFCIIQTPFKDGDIYEDKTITSQYERSIHFGQHDHVRVYSVEGLKNRLEKVGFQIKVLNFVEDQDNRHGFGETETVLMAYKIKPPFLTTSTDD